MTQTPWGWPTQQPVSGFSAWVEQYGVWLMVGAIVVLGFATRGKK